MGDDDALRERRRRLLERRELKGAAFCRALAAEADAWLSQLAEEAAGGNPRHLALVAAGGYGRSELCPYSDLDLVLVHDGRRAVGEIADAVWYPVWDQGVHLDHSVRRPSEVLALAADDLRVALGLLDGRRVWGDPRVAEPLLEAVVDRWRRHLGPVWLSTLDAQMEERHRSKGDVAFLLEPDLKDGHGGLRDFTVWRAIATYAPLLADYVDLQAMGAAAGVLLEVRVELHRLAGRAQERLLLQEQDQVATALGLPDADALMATVAAAGRRIAWVSDEAWRRRSLWEPAPAPRRTPFRRRRGVDTAATGSVARRPSPLPGEPDLAMVGGEIGLLPAAPAAEDPSLPLRLAAAAAERDLPIAHGALHRLADLTPAPADPWPEAARDALVRVLAAGHPGLRALETLDQQGLMVRVLPEWAQVRNKPQRNAYHRFTVDRHLLEAAANAAALRARVDRPDLLLIGTLLHDIGKGWPGDHTEVGIEKVGAIAARMGFGPRDVHVLQHLVRLHLLLPDTATRRDLDDRRTIETVAQEVGDEQTLDLLAALTEADSVATGPAAWGTWKAGLVALLVDRVRRFLRHGELDQPRPDQVAEHDELVAEARRDGQPRVSLAPPRLTVAAPDRPGLLASVAGILAVHGLEVLSADVTQTGGVAVEAFVVEPDRGRWPDPAVLAAEIGQLAETGPLARTGTLARNDRRSGQPLSEERLEARLDERSRTYAVGRRPDSAYQVVTEVEVHNEASASSTVIEVRAEDDVGLLHRVTRAIFECDLDVVAARVATLGREVVDAFYVRTAEGAKVTEGDRLAVLRGAVHQAATPRAAADTGSGRPAAGGAP